MREVVFVDFTRTAFTLAGGSLRSFSSTALGIACLKNLIQKSGILEKGAENVIDSVFAGSAFPDKLSTDPVRYITVGAGLPLGTESHRVEMQGGSGLASINHAAFQIALGYADVAIAGGMESHSTRPAFLSTTDVPFCGRPPRWLHMHLSPFADQDIPMAEISEHIAQKWDISRSACDDFALRSRERFHAACQSGLIGNEISNITIPATRKTPEIAIGSDENFEPQATAELLSSMAPFTDGGVLTAGNSATPKDGAAFVLMMTAEKANELGFVPFAKWITCADAGVEPRYAGIAPAYSSLKAIQSTGLSFEDIDVWECNETCAAQNLAVIREIEAQTGAAIDQNKWNPNGGAIAIGNPNSASGVRLAMSAMKQLEKTGGTYGLLSCSCGGGQGVSAIIENLRR